MSGLYIPGKMPTNGEVIVIMPNGQATLYASGDVAFFGDPKRIYKRIYKAIELHPHGRLIEADKLMANIRAHDYLLTAMCNSQENGMFTCGIQQAVDEADTIIPAEEE